MPGDQIDAFMGMPEDDQVRFLSGLDEETRNGLLAAVKQRGSRPAPVPYVVPKGGPKPTPTGEQIVQQQQDIHPFQNPVMQAVAGPVRAVWNAATSPFSLVKASTQPLDNESVLSESGANPAMNPMYPEWLQNATRRLGSRLVVQPAVEAHKTATALRESGHPIAAAGAELGAIPIIGSMGQEAGKRMAAGDIPGATTESVANAFMLGAPKTTGDVIGTPVSAVLNKFNIEPKLRAMLQNMGGAGPELTEQAVADVAKKTAETKAANSEAAKAYREKFGETAKSNAAADAAAQAKQQAQQQKIVQGSQIIDKANKLRDAVHAQASGEYDAIKGIIEKNSENAVAQGKPRTDSSPRQDFIDAAEKAKRDFIRGSKDSTKEFDQIIKGVVPDSEASTVAEQFQRAYGHKTIADALQDERVTKALQHELTPEQYKEITSGYADMPFNEQQGFYEELGRKLAQGEMPGDVYKAVDALHKFIGDKMLEVAKRNGVGERFVDARKFYAKHMDALYDSTSPINKIAESRDPAEAFQIANGAATDERMARFRDYANTANDPTVAKLLNDMQQTDKASKGSVPSRKTYPEQPEAKPLPQAPNVAEGIKEQAHKTFGGWKKLGKFDLGFFAQSAIAPFVYHTLFPLEGGAVMGRIGIPRVLDTPRVLEWLSKPTEAHMAELQKLPPEFQADVARQMQQFIAQQPTPVNVAPALGDWLQKATAAEPHVEPEKPQAKRKHP